MSKYSGVAQEFSMSKYATSEDRSRAMIDEIIRLRKHFLEAHSDTSNICCIDGCGDIALDQVKTGRGEWERSVCAKHDPGR